MKFVQSTTIILAIIFFSFGCNSKSAAADTKPTVATASTSNGAELDVKTVALFAISTERYASELSLSGKALARQESTLSLGVSGMVKKILVKRGDEVKKNDVLLKLRRETFVLGVQQAQAALAGARAQQDLLKTETGRLDNLLAANAAPTASRDELIAQSKGANAQVQIAETNLAKARKYLKDTSLKAPFDGVITDIMIEEGEQAYAMPPTMLATIVDVSTLEVQVFVPEEASSQVKTGDMATVTIDSAGIQTTGEVVFVSNVISQGARTFEVRVEIDNADNGIKAGSFARVKFEGEVNADSIFVSINAIARDDADTPYVMIVSDGVANKQLVKLGIVEGTRVQIKEGLQAGMQIVGANAGRIEIGQRVRGDAE